MNTEDYNSIKDIVTNKFQLITFNIFNTLVTFLLMNMYLTIARIPLE